MLRWIFCGRGMKTDNDSGKPGISVWPLFCRPWEFVFFKEKGTYICYCWGKKPGTFLGLGNVDCTGWLRVGTRIDFLLPIPHTKSQQSSGGSAVDVINVSPYPILTYFFSLMCARVRQLQLQTSTSTQWIYPSISWHVMFFALFCLFFNTKRKTQYPVLLHFSKVQSNYKHRNTNKNRNAI